MSQGVKSGKSVYFYPRPPRGGRQVRHTSLTGNGHISIHALREEGDACFTMYFPSHGPFLSTPSARRATLLGRDRRVHDSISIHALREEGDALQAHVSKAQCNFYPRTPRGGRRFYWIKLKDSFIFLSTPSARRATKTPIAIAAAIANFYPRPPRGGRQQKQRQNLYFLINYTTFCTNLEEP